MNKLAVFVEGYTEVIFLEKLIEEIAGRNKVLIEHRGIYGGNKVRRRSKLIKASKANTGQKYYVLIFNCGNDTLVKGRLLEEHENLTRDGYQMLIGIRDVRPEYTYADIYELEQRILPRYVKTKLAPVTFILSIMEIEAWFLAEATHFSNIDPSITVAVIKGTLGFDPEVDNMEQRPRPADDLNDCYALGGKAYDKSSSTTIDALDYVSIYTQLRYRINYLDRLISCIDAFLG